MRVLLSDINEFLEESMGFKDVVEILERMGVEVEDIKVIGDEFKKILPAKVLGVFEEGKINWVKAEVEGKVMEVVTTDDVRVGEYLLWADVPPKKFGEKISHGMFLSEEELGLEPQSLKLARVKNPGDYRREYLLGDVLLNLYITPNRPDLFGVMWIAWEVSVFSGIGYRGLNLENKPSFKVNFPVEIESEGCDLYTLRKIKIKNAGKTPDEIRRKLFLVGFNPINPPVDATNWAAYITGQPLHAFDVRKVKDGIRVVDSKGGEKFITFAGDEFTLPGGIVCIADSEKILALGGVIGSKESGTYEDTREVLLESAHFTPEYIRRTETSLGIFTESSIRFEKNPSAHIVEMASLYVSNLLKEWCDAEYSDIVRTGELKPLPRIYINPKKTRIYFGKDINMETILKKMGFGVLKDGETTIVVPPEHRTDISLQEDVFEEVARFIGYDNIPSKPSMSYPLPPSPRERFYDDISKFLASRGCYQTLSLGLFSKKEVEGVEGLEVISEFNESFKYLSASPIPHILKPLSNNLRAGNYPVPMFSLVRIYDTEGNERVYVVVGGYEPLEYRHIKGFLDALEERFGWYVDFNFPADDPYLHPAFSAKIIINGEEAGNIGVVRPEVARKFESKRKTFVWYITPRGSKGAKVESISKYHTTIKDISILVPNDVNFVEVKRIVRDISSEIRELERWETVDIYAGPNIPHNTRSFTLRFFIRPYKPLTDKEIGDIFNQIKDYLSKRFKVRGG